MFYYLYKITNMVNNKIYVGVHKTNNIHDGYMGSGKVISNAIKKYGIDNFQKEILEFFNTPEEMYSREKEYVTDDFLLREDVYNLRRGGHGGFEYLNKTGKNRHLGDDNWFAGNTDSSRIATLKRTQKFANAPELHDAWKSKISRSLKGRSGTFKGKQHSDESKKKISENNKLTSLGCKNSQYGTMWINNGTTTKKIKRGSPLPKGWVKGRIYLPS